MSQRIELTQVENQSFGISVEGHSVGFRLHVFNEVIYADITIDGSTVANSVRCVANGWLIPEVYRRQYSLGNFRFETDDYLYPSFADFGERCFLTYHTIDDIAKLS